MGGLTLDSAGEAALANFEASRVVSSRPSNADLPARSRVDRIGHRVGVRYEHD
jgi:hypothetical protein